MKRSIARKPWYGLGILAALLGLAGLAITAHAQTPKALDRPAALGAGTAGDVSLVKDVFPIIWHRENFNAHSSLNVVLALPGKRASDPPESLMFDAAGIGEGRATNFQILTRRGDGECNEIDFDLSELKSKGIVRQRSRLLYGQPALEEVFVPAKNPDDEPGWTRVYFKLVSTRVLDTTCANF